MKNKIIISLVVLLLLSFFLQGIFEANSTISTSDIPSIKPSGENIVIAKSNVPSGDDQSVVKEKEPKPDFVNPHGTELSNVEKFNMKPEEALVVTYDGKGQIFCQKKEKKSS